METRMEKWLIGYGVGVNLPNGNGEYGMKKTFPE
jgi:hypothetical protein